MVGIHNLTANVTSVRLCGVKGCCPIVEVHHAVGKVIITDDDGGRVTLTKEQWQEALTSVDLEV